MHSSHDHDSPCAEDLDTLIFASKDEFDRYFQNHAQLFEARWLWGQRLRDVTARPGEYAGWCGLCCSATRFAFGGKTGDPVNLREEMHCERCELNARNRVALSMVLALAGRREARVYSTEQASPAFRWLKRAFPDAIGSEYFDEQGGARLRRQLQALFDPAPELRHEDVTALSFADRDLDLVLSSDVLEHVPDYRSALAEFARVLRPGGDLVLTVPFMDNSHQSLLRAEIEADGSIVHHVEPEYHGDPVSPHGVLAFHSFGWDLLDALREAGFADAHWCLPWAPAQAVFSGLWWLHARR